MGFFDWEVRSSLDDMFDMNRDGKLDVFEQCLQYDYINEQCGNDIDDVDDWDDSDDFDEDDF